MANRWWSRAVLRLVPRAWRDTVARDLEEEASASGRGTPWFTMQVVGAAGNLRRFSFSDTLRTDLFYALRSMQRSPSYTVAAVLTFALGIGANIAVFAVIDRMMFRPLPYAEPDRLVHLHSLVQTNSFPSARLAAGTTAELSRRARAFEAIATAETREGTTAIEGLGEPVRLTEVSPNILRVLGVAPIAGRDFSDADTESDVRPILLTDEEWARRFDRSPSVFDLPMTLERGRRPHRVVGILPEGFLVPSSGRAEHIDGLVLRARTSTGPNAFRELGPSAIGRLAPGATVSEAQAELDLIADQLALENPEAPPFALGVMAQPVREGLFMFYLSYASLTVVGVVLVLLVACVNLATLLLARGRSREQETAIRRALGASAWRLLRLSVAEALVLCVLSTTLALVACQAIYSSLLAVVPAALRGVAVEPFDLRIVAASLAVASVCSVVAAVYPAFRSLGVNVLDGLRPDTRSGPSRLRGGGTMIAIEAALGVVLVAGAIATVANFTRLAYEFPGWDERGLYHAGVRHGFVRTDGAMSFTPERVRSALEAIRDSPGVRAAGATTSLTLGRDRSAFDAFWRDRNMEGFREGVSAGFFAATGTPVVVGRDLVEAEVAAAGPVGIVNRSGARQLWPGLELADVLNQHVELEGVQYRIVGVAEDVRNAPGEAAAAGLYLPVTSPGVRVRQSALDVAVRMDDGVIPDPVVFAERLNAAFGENLSVSLESIADRAAPYLQRPRFQAILFGSLAVIALVLAAVGLYALAAFDVARRRREMGVRLSLGATSGHLRRSVIGAAVRPVLIGSAVGLMAAWWSAQFLQAFLFDVDAHDPRIYALVAIVLVLTAILAAWLPARRAARTDPADVLRAV